MSLGEQAWEEASQEIEAELTRAVTGVFVELEKRQADRLNRAETLQKEIDEAAERLCALSEAEWRLGPRGPQAYVDGVWIDPLLVYVRTPTAPLFHNPYIVVGNAAGWEKE